MEDYPRTLGELEARFGNEQACRDYLVALRWPDGFVCPACENRAGWKVTALRYECAGCHRQVSATAGTIFHATRMPLKTWFRAIWWVVAQKNGASALGMKRVLGLGSYETAWTWLHKLRRAMVRPGRDRLTGIVEVDETYVGGLEEGVHGRQTFKKALIVIAAQEEGTGIGRIRMRCIPDVSGETLGAFVQEAVEPGSTVRTDGWRGYDGLKALGYCHDGHPLRGNRKAASDLLPRVHRIVSLFKRWLLGTHQGAVSPEHLAHYLDEYVFRFNRRTSQHRGKLFYRCLQQAMQVEPVPYKALIKHVRGRKPQRIGVT
jgi:transposase-like protein